MEHEPKTSRQELAKMLAPLTVLPGGDRLNKVALEAYYAVFNGYYPHELRSAAEHCFKACEFFPTPKKMLEFLTNQRRVLGSRALEAVKEEHERLQRAARGLQGPGPSTSAAPPQIR